MAMAVGIKVKANRCLVRSENVAIIIENANAAAHGGIEYSCVRMASTKAQHTAHLVVTNTYFRSHRS